MSLPVYIAIAFVLWSVTTSVFMLGTAATVWTWLLVGGGLALFSLVAVRMIVANELGLHARESAALPPAVARSLARSLGRLDTGLLVLIIGMLPLVAAMLAGVAQG